MRAAAGIAVGLVVGFVGLAGGAAGCGDSYQAVLDSLPIILQRAPLGAPAASGITGDGALIVTASPPDHVGPTISMLIDTGTPLTLMNGSAGTSAATQMGGFDLIDPIPPPPPPPLPAPGPAVRGQFRGVSLIQLPLQPIGDGTLSPGGILGGDILRLYSVDLRFGATSPERTCSSTTGLCSWMTFWAHLGPDLGFLQDTSYAVLRFSLFGGGEVTAQGDPDFLGQRGPLVLPATRVVLRACAVPDPFTPDQPRMKCCTEKDAEKAPLTTGVDLALLVDTGIGPLVLSQSAWARVVAKLSMSAAATPAMTPGPLRVATWPAPIDALWATIPNFALVDNETGSDTDPGPCVELGRSRRIEQVSYQLVNGIAPDACTQPCDNDPRDTGKAQNSAAYLELTGTIPVAVIADEEPYLQGLRFEVRPEGPELDGLVGAGALKRSRVEIDYLSNGPRAVFSCELDAPRGECWAAARCPRLPDSTSTHRCFGLPPHTLAAVACAPSGC